MQARTANKFPNGFFEELFVIVSNENGLVVQFLRGCEKLLLLTIIELFKVPTDALIVLALLKVQVNDALNFHLRFNAIDAVSAYLAPSSPNTQVFDHVDLDESIHITSYFFHGIVHEEFNSLLSKIDDYVDYHRTTHEDDDHMSINQP